MVLVLHLVQLEVLLETAMVVLGSDKKVKTERFKDKLMAKPMQHMYMRAYLFDILSG